MGVHLFSFGPLHIGDFYWLGPYSYIYFKATSNS